MDYIKSLIDEYKNIALSDTDLLTLMDGKANVVVYPDIHKYRSIDRLLGNYGVCFILYEWKPHYGHWCCLIRHGNLIEFFDPYGNWPDSCLEDVPEPYRTESNQLKPYLTNLMIKCDYDLSYNEFQFQKLDEEVKDCGRWCCVRALLKELPLKDFKDLFFNEAGDDLVTVLTS